jgi:lysophospholipase L1-like esterase
MGLKRILCNCLLPVFCCVVYTSALAVGSDGDINIDGQVNAIDVLWSQQALFDTRSLASDQFIHADVAPLVAGVPHPDGVFNLGDVSVIYRIALGLLDFSYPSSQFNIGDSIGEGEASNGTIGQPHHETVWSTGYNATDVVNSFNERFEAFAPDRYFENNASRDAGFNRAVSGSVMADFAAQAQSVVDLSPLTPAGVAGMVNVLLGNNDVCAVNNASMTDPALFEAQYRAGLDVLAADKVTRKAQINVSGIPDIYWLWIAKRNILWCRVFVWPFVPCENLLNNPADDCASSASSYDPDNVYPGDGSNCQRRKEFHRLIRDTYNPILRDVVAEYRDSGQLPNARFTDIFDVRLQSADINGGDCFHPSNAGHALLAQQEWCRSHCGNGDPACAN